MKLSQRQVMSSSPSGSFSASVCGSATHHVHALTLKYCVSAKKFSVFISKKIVEMRFLYCQDASASVSRFAVSNQLMGKQEPRLRLRQALSTSEKFALCECDKSCFYLLYVIMCAH